MKVITFIVCLFALSVSAQTTTTSPYSAYGIGDMESDGFASQMAQGGTRFGSLSSSNVNIANPATYVALKDPTFSAGLNHRRLIAAQDTVDQASSGTYFNYFTMSLPVVSRKISTTFGLTPLSSMGYNTRAKSTNSDGNVSTLTTDGHGNISRVFIGLGVALIADSSNVLAVGGNFSYLFGGLTKNQDLQPTQGYSIRRRNFAHISDIMFDASLIYQHKFSDKLIATLGAAYSIGDSLSTEEIFLVQSYETDGTGSYVKDTLAVDTVMGQTFVPARLGMGMSFDIGKGLKLSFDYSQRDWSNFVDFDGATQMVKAQQFAMGVQFIPDPNNQADIFKQIRYRGGFRYNKSRLMVKDQQIMEYGISFGVGVPIPISRSQSTVNLAIEAGKRGVDTGGLLEEQFTNITIGFTFSPSYKMPWFVKRQIR